MKVLVVDDSKFSQLSTMNLLKKIDSDIEFLFADNGEEGLVKFKETNPDFALVDLLMPVLSGKELVQLIKDFDSNANIIVVSADVQKSVQEEMLSYGALAFVNKPLNEEKVEKIFELVKGAENDQR